MPIKPTRLADIATRQRHGRARDAVFACFVALAAVIGATSVATCVSVASTTHLAQR
ncbi:MAG TPA: hypothetical protein VFQ53_06055 [Kofleriaceae bacterium]|nr:hypothetical protein [Kofleriaceae bacterium]